MVLTQVLWFSPLIIVPLTLCHWYLDTDNVARPPPPTDYSHSMPFRCSYKRLISHLKKKGGGRDNRPAFYFGEFCHRCGHIIPVTPIKEQTPQFIRKLFNCCEHHLRLTNIVFTSLRSSYILVYFTFLNRTTASPSTPYSLNTESADVIPNGLSSIALAAARKFLAAGDVVS